MVKTILILTLLSLNASAATETHWKAKLETAPNISDNGIPFLSLGEKEVDIQTGNMLQFTQLKGKFTEPVTQASINSKVFPVQEDGTFEVQFGFPPDVRGFAMTAVDKKNRIYRTHYRFKPVDKSEDDINKLGPRWKFVAGGGFTLLSFRQKNVTPFSQGAFTVKAGANFKIIPEQLDMGLVGFVNSVPFGSTSPEGLKVQYIGLNGRIGYNLIGAPNALRVNVNAGVYYNTSLSLVGFANMYGPQLYPEFIYLFQNGHSLIGYGKFSPALSFSKKISFTENRELAIGAHYSFPLSPLYRLSVGIDISQLTLNLKNDWASTNTYSISSGFSF